MRNEEILQKAINTHGCIKQIDMLHEEIGEFMQAMNKVKRLGGVSEKQIIHPSNYNGTDEQKTKYSIAYFNLCSEVADNKILFSQVEMMLDKHAIDLSEERKIIRLGERLEIGTY